MCYFFLLIISQSNIKQNCLIRQQMLNLVIANKLTRGCIFRGNSLNSQTPPPLSSPNTVSEDFESVFGPPTEIKEIQTATAQEGNQQCF